MVKNVNLEKLYTEGSDDNFVYHENNHAEFKITTTAESVLNFTTLFLFVGFLAIYYILYYAFKSAFGSNSTDETVKSHTINVTIITLLLIGSIYFYATLSPANQSDFFNNLGQCFINKVVVLINEVVMFFKIPCYSSRAYGVFITT